MFSGSIVALVTPFSLSNTIDFKKLAELIEYHVLSSTDALLILGTTGESTSLNEYEKDRLVEFVINQNDKRMKILVIGQLAGNLNDYILQAKKKLALRNLTLSFQPLLCKFPPLINLSVTLSTTATLSQRALP